MAMARETVLFLQLHGSQKWIAVFITYRIRKVDRHLTALFRLNKYVTNRLLNYYRNVINFV